MFVLCLCKYNVHCSLYFDRYFSQYFVCYQFTNQRVGRRQSGIELLPVSFIVEINYLLFSVCFYLSFFNLEKRLFTFLMWFTVFYRKFDVETNFLGGCHQKRLRGPRWSSEDTSNGSNAASMVIPRINVDRRIRRFRRPCKGWKS